MASKYKAEDHLRSRLSRWHLQGVPRIQASRALRGFADLRELVPPRVVAAVFSTIWNRWPTARRSQRRAARECRCQLGCPGRAEDSIEHYSHCAVLHGFASRRLNFHVTGGFLPVWCLVHGSDPTMRTKAALMAYVGYRATNTARHMGGTTPNHATEMLGQLLYDAVRDHREAAAVVNNSFVRRPRSD